MPAMDTGLTPASSLPAHHLSVALTPLRLASPLNHHTISTRLARLRQLTRLEPLALTLDQQHLRLVLAPRAEPQSDAEVLHCWHQMFGGNALSRRAAQQRDLLNPSPPLATTLARWRERLASPELFVRLLLVHQLGNAPRPFDLWRMHLRAQWLLDLPALWLALAYTDGASRQAGALWSSRGYRAGGLEAKLVPEVALAPLERLGPCPGGSYPALVDALDQWLQTPIRRRRRLEFPAVFDDLALTPQQLNAAINLLQHHSLFCFARADQTGQLKSHYLLHRTRVFDGY